MVKLTQTLSYQQIESQHQYIVDSIYYCLIMKMYNQLYQAISISHRSLIYKICSRFLVSRVAINNSIFELHDYDKEKIHYENVCIN